VATADDTRKSCGSWSDPGSFDANVYTICPCHRGTALSRQHLHEPAGLTPPSHDAPSRPRVVRRTDDGNACWSRFSGVLAESFASAEPTGDVRDVVGPTAEGCRAACTARSFNSNNTPTTITKARLHVGEIVLRGIILGRTHGKRLSQGPPCDRGHGRQIIG
jgi:hypothetical protein